MKAYEELFQGYRMDASEALQKIFRDVEGYDDLVLVKDIPFHSHCEHHMVPFYGTAHIAYYPADGVVGLSKLARVVETFARRLQTQETMTAEITQSIQERCTPAALRGDRGRAYVHDHAWHPEAWCFHHHLPVHGVFRMIRRSRCGSSRC